MAVDLGDNYPRGVHLHRFPNGNGDATPGRISHRVVYEFKTRHGTTPTSPANVEYPPYPEISTTEQQFYKWSNDNDVYTELAHPGVIYTDDGNMLVE